MRPVGLEPTSPGPFPGVILHSTIVSLTEGSFDLPTSGWHLPFKAMSPAQFLYATPYWPSKDTFYGVSFSFNFFIFV